MFSLVNVSAETGIDQRMSRCKGGATIAPLCRGVFCATVGGMDIRETEHPAGSLIAQYAAREAHHTDCFEVAIDADVTLPAYITAFYTQPLFRAERLVLRLAARAPSSDADVAALAAGTATRFAVWEQTGRTDDQLLMTQRGGHTCSWLQAAEGVLRFGSVVVPVKGRGGRLTLGPVFHSLLGAHKVYSRTLLAGAARRLGQGVARNYLKQ